MRRALVPALALALALPAVAFTRGAWATAPEATTPVATTPAATAPAATTPAAITPATTTPAATTPAATTPAATAPAATTPAATAPADTAPLQPVLVPPRYRLHVGVQLGFSHFVGFHGMATFYAAGRPRFDVDLLWEPSGYLQSYSVGGAYHVADGIFFVGTRLRLLETRAPWSRGYDLAGDNHLGVGLEAGLRAPVVGPERRWLVTFTVGATGVPTASNSLQWLLNVNVGIAWAALSR